MTLLYTVALLGFAISFCAFKYTRLTYTKPVKHLFYFISAMNFICSVVVLHFVLTQ